jgi:ketosteroid isomerase-like protein
MEATMSISQAFSDLNSKFVETVNSHDAHRWAALFSEDAVLIRRDNRA